jgi:hypothetical protein
MKEIKRIQEEFPALKSFTEDNLVIEGESKIIKDTT